MDLGLTIAGLSISFIGSFMLVIESLLDFRNPFKPIPQIYSERKGDKMVRKDWVLVFNPKQGKWNKVTKLTKKEERLIFWLTLISTGFLVQILSYF